MALANGYVHCVICVLSALQISNLKPIPPPPIRINIWSDMRQPGCRGVATLDSRGTEARSETDSLRLPEGRDEREARASQRAACCRFRGLAACCRHKTSLRLQQLQLVDKPAPAV